MHSLLRDGREEFDKVLEEDLEQRLPYGRQRKTGIIPQIGTLTQMRSCQGGVGSGRRARCETLVTKIDSVNAGLNGGRTGLWLEAILINSRVCSNRAL